MGAEFDAAKVTAALASHKSKNYTNAYMLVPNTEEAEARRRADWKMEAPVEDETDVEDGAHDRWKMMMNSSAAS